MSLLTMIQGACDRLSLSRPSSVIAATDLHTRQLLGLAQQEGKELVKRHTWQKLTKEKTFSSTAAAAQTGAIPSDFDHFIDNTFFNRTAKRHLEGPLNPQEWQFAQAVTATTVIESFRQRGDDILITPTPSTGTTYAYEYVSNQWCESSGGADQSVWTADTDVGLLPEELMTLGVIWRFRQAKGLDYSEQFRTYELQLAQIMARDGGKPTLHAGKRLNPFKPRGVYVPDGSWNL